MSPAGQALPPARRVDICESTESGVESKGPPFCRALWRGTALLNTCQPPGRWLDTSVIYLLVYRGD